MAGPSRPLQASGPPDSNALGRVPRNGDFARLLEAASAPAAHRLEIDRDDGDARAARATRFGGAPPRTPDAAPTDPAESSATPHRDANRSGTRPPAPSGPPGMAAGRTLPAVSRIPASDEPAEVPVPPPADPPDLAALAGRAVRAWMRRPPKDRVAIALLAIGAGWMLLTIGAATLAQPGDGVGALVVLALIAFFVLGGWRRRRRPGDPKG